MNDTDLHSHATSGGTDPFDAPATQPKHEYPTKYDVDTHPRTNNPFRLYEQPIHPVMWWFWAFIVLTAIVVWGMSIIIFM